MNRKSRAVVMLAVSLFLGGADRTEAQSGTLRNISSRAQVNTSDNLDEILIAGLIVQGPPGATKKVLIRAIGPSLTGHGVAGALADTVLAVFSGPNSIASNDNWRDSQEAEILATQIPPANDLESAVVLDLLPGDYTAWVYGTVDTLPFPGDPRGRGVALVEVYDLEPDSSVRLANLSTRAPVRTGENVLIGGFIVGDGSVNVLVRAIGPSLGTGGAPGPLQDPTLGMYDADGNLIGVNDDWQEDQRAAIKETGIPPTDPRESAILKTLTPGNYTAILRGKNDSIGRALVEIYMIE